ncbi:MAG: transcription elongation factor GreA [Methylocystaceae bacterium]
MTEKEVILTSEGLKKLEDELELYKGVRRREVAERIKQAIDFGDISENSEYDDAKNEQAMIEGKIASLEKLLRNARLVEADEVRADVVSIGSRVWLEDLKNKRKLEFILVSSAEANPKQKKISDESPVGKGILGKPVNSVVEVNAPVGTIKYKILKIEK